MDPVLSNNMSVEHFDSDLENDFDVTDMHPSWITPQIRKDADFLAPIADSKSKSKARRSIDIRPADQIDWEDLNQKLVSMVKNDQ